MKAPVVPLIIAATIAGLIAAKASFGHEAAQTYSGCASDCNIAAHNMHMQSGSRVADSGPMSNMPGMEPAPKATASPRGDGSMSMSMPMHNGHMQMTPPRSSTSADRERAALIVAGLRVAIEPYKDYKAALAAGYKPFHPEIKMAIYHFTSMRNAFLNQFSFDPARPTSLMYKPVSGGYELVGAMYTAPLHATLDDLNARVPLSVATWHLHVNLCFPPAGMGREMLQPHPQFGFAGSITTQSACDAAGGRFVPVIYNWMVHVWPYESDPTKIWATEEHPGAMDNT